MRTMLDLRQKRFGKLTALEPTIKRDDKGEAIWRCVCDCGQTRLARSSALRSGEAVSCGCTRTRIIDLTGRRFGRLTVLGRDGSTKYQPKWLCRCDCGKTVSPNGQCLREGQTKSCGCLKLEAARENRKLAVLAHTKPPGIAQRNIIFRRYKEDAKRSGRAFALSLDTFTAITQKRCYYCGSKPTAFSKHLSANGAFVGNGLDRKDNAQGYTVANVVPCCRTCNYAKRAMSQSEFFALAVRIVRHHHLS